MNVYYLYFLLIVSGPEHTISKEKLNYQVEAFCFGVSSTSFQRPICFSPTSPPLTPGFSQHLQVFLLLLVFTHSICSPWQTGVSLPQPYPQAGSFPGKLQAKYTWNSLNSQLVGSNKHPLETSSRYIIPMFVFTWEGEFSHSYDKQSQLMLK